MCLLGLETQRVSSGFMEIYFLLLVNPTGLQSETGLIYRVVYYEPEPIIQLLLTVIGSLITTHRVGYFRFLAHFLPIKHKSGLLNVLVCE